MVAHFCKLCNNLLMIEVDDKDCCTLYCVTCPYRRPIHSYVATVWTRDNTSKPEDFFVDIEQTRKLLPTTTTEACPKCYQMKAYYYETQTRSCDEPMTIFYRCANTECNHSWKV